jgi:hypothetical protein
MAVPDLFKIVARGLQDERLQPGIKGVPSIDRYVSVYKATTRWAAQFVRIDFDTLPDFGGQASVTIPRRANFVHRLFLVVVLPDIYSIQNQAAIAAGDTSILKQQNFLGPTFGWTNSIGHAIIQSITLEIGGVAIASLDGRLLEVLDELYEPPEKLPVKNKLIGRVENYNSFSLLALEPLTVRVPLPFWFTQNLAQSLPIEALSVDTVRCQVKFAGVENVYYTTARVNELNHDYEEKACNPPGAMPGIQGATFYQKDSTSPTKIYGASDKDPFYGINGRTIPDIKVPSKLHFQDAYLLAEYISVDNYEAINLRKGDLEYKVPLYNRLDVQDTNGQPYVRTTIPFNNPTQDIMWMFHNPEADRFNNPFLASRDLSGTDTSFFAPWNTTTDRFQYAFSEPLAEVALYYNGTQRFKHTTPALFRTLLPLLHYRKAAHFWRYIYVYPFSHGPGCWDDKELGNPYQPKGLANFDKLSRKEIVFTMQADRFGKYPPLQLHLWTTTWNVLRIYGGRAAMLFAV